jgi:hypothetical protein
MSFGERFLREPGRMPAGGRAGDLFLDLRIAGLPFRLAGLEASQRAALSRRFAGFAVDPGVPHVARLEVLSGSPRDFRSVDTRGWEYDLDLESDATTIEVAGLALAARLDREPLRARLVTSAGAGQLCGVVENLLRLMAAHALLAQGGALLHAAGIAAAGEALVFFGPSGAGKTTLSRLARSAGREVLGDDLVALTFSRGEVRVAPVPFGGDFRAVGPGCTPRVGGVLRLRQARDHKLVPLRPGSALAGLAACAPFVNRDRHAVPALLANLEGLLRSVPARELHFAPRPGFLELCEVAA